MLRVQAVLTAAVSAIAAAATFSGSSALEFTRRAVEFGPRPPGSAAIRQLQGYILGQLKGCKCQVTEDNFTARTPRGEIAMKNIIARFPGKVRGAAKDATAQAIVITGHYDTKFFPKGRFVGASDGGSSTGLLLEMARIYAGEPRVDDLYLVWFDGEEAFGEWSETDSLYGSRHLADLWRKDGTLRRIKALINVDMIGDKRLNIKQELNSNAALRRLVWRAAAESGYQAYFVNDTLTIDDDHMPFVRLGVPAIDLIDYDYDPWHTDEDTMDKLSAQSLDVVGTVLVEVIKRLERQ
jgi:Zn-dependent M28 family amino/carboxypeptidase